MNRLSREKSPYLRHSSHQKIDWYPWSDEAFERAEKENKPIFLSTGAVWCHWCHVMAKECFENEEIAEILNDNFINIKLDRDERPDIDRRYQQAIAIMGFGGGWPLSVFLTPDRKPFYGGTYFPPEDILDRPGFKRVLRAVADYYKAKRDEISQYSEKLMDSLKPGPLASGEINESMINEAAKNILSTFDPQHGGFGSAPKFSMSGALELLINRYFFTRNESLGYAVKKTLESMAKGGFHDQIGGGFHRYATDEVWIMPHFEKMADDNAWLLRNYVDAYFLFGDKYFKEVAEGIIRFIRNVLSDPEGGFYANQDADVTPDDEGGYFTWRDEDFRRVLNDEEYKVLSLHFIHEWGSMHHDKSKKVLFIVREAKEIADMLKKDTNSVQETIISGKEKLLKERNNRKAPFVDDTLYTSLNGMLITAYLKAYRVFKESYLKDFSLKSLHRIMKSNVKNDELFHTEGVKALLDDYIYFIEALIASYEVTGDPSYLQTADKHMELCIKKFWDYEGGGFFDTEEEIVGLRLKGIEDVPHPSANSLGIILLLKLYYMTDKNKYQEYAEKALGTFSVRAKDIGIHSGYYFCAMDTYFHMLKLTIEASSESELTDSSLSFLIPYMSIVYGEDKGRIVPCFKNVCYEPIDRADILKEFLMNKYPTLRASG
jgi:uncharacterized protein YyaL (SSP411 family)